MTEEDAAKKDELHILWMQRANVVLFEDTKDDKQEAV